MEKNPLPIAEDDSDRKLLSDIANVGWHLVGIEEDSDGPGYVFSVGLYHSFDQPEIMIVGLKSAIACHLINAIGEQMRQGIVFKDLQTVEGIAHEFPLSFRAVNKEYYRNYLGYALWFYESYEFPVLQCIWPDKLSRFPADANCEKSCRETQTLSLPGTSAS